MGLAQVLSAGVESRPCTLKEKFLEVFEDIEFSCVSSAVWDIKHSMLYLEKTIHFMAIINVQSKMPSLHHTHSSHSLMLTSRTTSRSICSSSPPHRSSPLLVTEGTYTGSLEQFHRHAWLIPQVVNQDINKLLSRGLQGLTSSEYSLAAGFQQCGASFWLQLC